MQVNYHNNTIEKPQGKRTSARIIQFDELNRYIEIFQKVVDITSPTKAVTLWIATGCSETHVVNVLYSVIVLFGGGYRIWGRFGAIYNSSTHKINEVLSYVYNHRDEDVDILRRELKQILGLGGLSYSTKMLRFLSPNHVVLDSILQEELCISEKDYHIFASHCRQIAKILQVNAVDVESGLYAYVQIANPDQRKYAWKRYQEK